MPRSAGGYAYVERLRVPGRWWAIAFTGVLIGGAEVFAGFNWGVALIVYAALGIPTAVLLVGMGRLAIRLDTAGLRIGRTFVPVSEIAGARPLNTQEARRAMRPPVDPEALLFVRGYVKTAVLVGVRHDGGVSGRLLSTRHPDELAAAIQRAADGNVSE